MPISNTLRSSKKLRSLTLSSTTVVLALSAAYPASAASNVSANEALVAAANQTKTAFNTIPSSRTGSMIGYPFTISSDPMTGVDKTFLSIKQKGETYTNETWNNGTRYCSTLSTEQKPSIRLLPKKFHKAKLSCGKYKENSANNSLMADPISDSIDMILNGKLFEYGELTVDSSGDIFTLSGVQDEISFSMTISLDALDRIREIKTSNSETQGEQVFTVQYDTEKLVMPTGLSISEKMLLQAETVKATRDYVKQQKPTTAKKAGEAAKNYVEMIDGFDFEFNGEKVKYPKVVSKVVGKQVIITSGPARTTLSYSKA